MRVEKPKNRRTMPEPAPGLNVNLQELAQNPQAPNDTFQNTGRSRTVPTEQPRRFRLIPSAQAQTPSEQEYELPENFNYDSAMQATYGDYVKIAEALGYSGDYAHESDSARAMNFVSEAERLSLEQEKADDERFQEDVGRAGRIFTVNTPLYTGGILAAREAARAAGPYLYNAEEWARSLGRKPVTPRSILTAADNVVYQNRLGIPFGRKQRFYRPGVPQGPIPEQVAKKAAKKVAGEGMEGLARAGGRAISAGILATIPWDDVLAALPTIASMAAYGELPSDVIAQKENEAYYDEREKAQREGRLTVDGRIVDPLPQITQGVERRNQGAINRYFKRNPGRVK